jgi:small subunit ribosomal protein S16
MLPKERDKRVVIDVERAKYWLSKGAQPSDRVTLFLAGFGPRAESPRSAKRRRSPRRRRRRRSARKEAAAKAAEAAPAA